MGAMWWENIASQDYCCCRRMRHVRLVTPHVQALVMASLVKL